MKVLILGGNGYLGSKLASRLLNAGHSVACTRRECSDISRLIDIADSVTWIPASVEKVEEYLKRDSADCVVNMACSYGRGRSEYLNTIESNFVFPLRMISVAMKNGTSRFITIGTSLPPKFDIYSLTKTCLSEFGEFFAERDGISFQNIVLEMYYGADEPEGRFLPSVIRKMLRGVDVETTLGSQRRDIIAVEDVINAISLIIHSRMKGYSEISVGTGEAPTISEVIDYIWEKTGKKSAVYKGRIPMRNNEPDCIADTRTLKTRGLW